MQLIKTMYKCFIMDQISDILPFRLLYKRTINGESLSILSKIIGWLAVWIDVHVCDGENRIHCIKCSVSNQIETINRTAQLPFMKKLFLERAQRLQYFRTRRDILNYRKKLVWMEMRPAYLNMLSDDVMIYMLQYISVNEGYSKLIHTLNKRFYEMWYMRVFYTITNYLCGRDDQITEYIHHIFRCLTYHHPTDAIFPIVSYVTSYQCMIVTVSADVLYFRDDYYEYRCRLV